MLFLIGENKSPVGDIYPVGDWEFFSHDNRAIENNPQFLIG